MLALKVGEEKGLIDESTMSHYINELKELPARMTMLPEMDELIHKVALQIMNVKNALYLGRGDLFPLAMEGALKLKEISYIHAEGYASGEMKHGPIALVDENTPTVIIAPYDDLFEKNLSNLKEVEARRGQVVLITDEKGKKAAGENNNRI